MAYIEHDQLDAQLKKLENVCAENGFTYKFLRDKYPVRIIITPDGTMDGQMSMLDNPVGYNTKGSALAFVFVDGDVYLNPGKEGGLSLSKRLQNKLRTIAEKVYFNYLKVFFTILHVHCFLGTASAFTAEKHTNCTIVPQSLGGSTYVGMPMNVYLSNEKVLGTATVANGVPTFTPTTAA